jgi:hypothetical protein
MSFGKFLLVKKSCKACLAERGEGYEKHKQAAFQMLLQIEKDCETNVREKLTTPEEARKTISYLIPLFIKCDECLGILPLLAESIEKFVVAQLRSQVKQQEKELAKDVPPKSNKVVYLSRIRKG